LCFTSVLLFLYKQKNVKLSLCLAEYYTMKVHSLLKHHTMKMYWEWRYRSTHS